MKISSIKGSIGNVLLVSGLIILMIFGGIFSYRYFFHQETELIIDILKLEPKLEDEFLGGKITIHRNLTDKKGDIFIEYINPLYSSPDESLRQYAIWSCTHHQEYYYRDFPLFLKGEFFVEESEKTNIGRKLEDFLVILKGYSLRSVNIASLSPEGSKLYSCLITGQNDDENLIGLFGRDGTRYSFKLNSI